MVEPRLARAVVTFLVAAALASCVLLSLARWWGPDQHQAVLLASFAPYGLPAYAALAVLLAVVVVRAGRRLLPAVGLLLALAGTALHAAWLAPAWTPSGPAADGAGAHVRVATLNLPFGQADTDEVAAWLSASEPDVVVLTETTPEALAALEADARVGAAGSGRWPHRAGRAMPQAAGTVVLSAFPLGATTSVPVANGGHRVPVQAPVPFVLTAAHTAYPLRGLEPWRSDLRALERDAATTSGTAPHVVVGDLNATRDHRALRDVLAAGDLREAGDLAGSGWQPTWPTPGQPTAYGARLPLALLGLDHVLVSPQVGATRTATTRVAGTDHLALVADLTGVGGTRTLGGR